MRHPRRNEVYRDVGAQPHAPEDEDFVEIVDAPFEDDAALVLSRDPSLTSARGEALRHLLYLFGKDEAINGRFYEMLVADGGEYLDSKGRPAFNSDAGVRALQWFVDLYKAKAVPPGTPTILPLPFASRVDSVCASTCKLKAMSIFPSCSTARAATVASPPPWNSTLLARSSGWWP